MRHLKLLKYGNYISAVMLLLAMVATAGSVVASLMVLNMAEPVDMAAVIPSVAITALLVLMMAAMMILALVSARGIEQGRGRIPQTALAILSLSSVPLGTLFGGYALWVCWLNEDTKASFPPVRPKHVGLFMGMLVGLGVVVLALLAVSIAAVLPFDHAALDAQWQPLADRSQRLDREGCGLSEVATTAGCQPAQPAEVQTEAISFPTRSDAMGFTGLRGTVYRPQGLEGPRPAAILVHGSGPQDRHVDVSGELISPQFLSSLAIFDALAMSLAEQGLVVLAYDKRTCGACYPTQHAGADYSDFRFPLLIEDARAGIDWLAQQDDVQDNAIVVVGHSQGGGFAPHIAASDERVAAVVMLAGFVSTFRQELLEQLERSATMRREKWDLLGAWNIEAQSSAISACMAKLESDYDPADECLGGGVSLQAVAEYDALNATTLQVISGLQTPLCALSGTVDRNVMPDQLLAIQAASQGDAEFHLLKGVGHGLRNLLDPAKQSDIDPQVIDVLSAFLASVATPSEAERDGSAPSGPPQ